MYFDVAGDAVAQCINRVRDLYPHTSLLLVKYTADRDVDGNFDPNKVYSIQLVLRDTGKVVTGGAGCPTVVGTFSYIGLNHKTYQGTVQFTDDLYECAQYIPDIPVVSNLIDAVEAIKRDNHVGNPLDLDTVDFCSIDEIERDLHEPSWNFGSKEIQQRVAVGYYTGKVVNLK
jgi:hypothetical protein